MGVKNPRRARCDPGPGRGLLFGGRGGGLFRAVGGVGQGGGKAVRPAAGCQLLPGPGQVTARLGKRVVQVEPPVAGQGRRQHGACDVAAGDAAAEGGLEGGLVGCVFHRAPAVHAAWPAAAAADA